MLWNLAIKLLHNMPIRNHFLLLWLLLRVNSLCHIRLLIGHRRGCGGGKWGFISDSLPIVGTAEIARISGSAIRSVQHWNVVREAPLLTYYLVRP